MPKNHKHQEEKIRGKKSLRVEKKKTVNLAVRRNPIGKTIIGIEGSGDLDTNSGMYD